MKFKQLVSTLCACGIGSVAFGGISITNKSIGVNFYTLSGGDPAPPINSGVGPEIAGTNFSASSTAIVNRQDHWNDIGRGP
ncbi:MAG: hypothetical protein GVY10_07170 [Verrucomicrobia bacterium]|jgi:hypothetical protein|nr:hypothetical protein [Verrucomicrobiota bacterium]